MVPIHLLTSRKYGFRNVGILQLNLNDSTGFRRTRLTQNYRRFPLAF